MILEPRSPPDQKSWSSHTRASVGNVNIRYEVFLSHSSVDKPRVEELARRLKQAGIEPFLDKWNLIPGQPWQEALEEALRQSASCAVIIGSGPFGPWRHEEMRAALEHRVSGSRGKFPVIPVLIPAAERPQDHDLPMFLKRMTWVEFQKGLDDEPAFHRLVCGIRGLAPGPGQAIFEGECPYRGLEVFEEKHARFFFGREAQVDWLLSHRLAPMAESSHATRFLAILGPSGSGKSSLALAGLIPALRAGKVEGSAGWPIVMFRPGSNPLESLAIELSRAGGIESSAAAIQGLISSLLKDRTTLHLTARLALEAPAARLVVLADQFEEIFTLCNDEALRRALIENLLHAATVVGGPVLVLLTMRVDFLGKCAADSDLAAALSDGQELVGPMSKDELRLAIERPAELAGCFLEQGLTDLLLQDVQGQAGALPLLEYTLLELWRERLGNRLTIAAYNGMGKVQGALEHRADAVLEEFRSRPGELEICRRVFLRLTQPGEGTEDTKRRAAFDELIASEAERPAVEEVVRKLADARLITTVGDPKDPGKTSVEVAHEALIRGWKELRQWIEVDRAGLRTHHRLTEAANEWDAAARDPSYLYTGAKLAVASEWVASHRNELNPLEAEYLAKSEEEERRQRQASEEEERRQRQAIAGDEEAIKAHLIASRYEDAAKRLIEATKRLEKVTDPHLMKRREHFKAQHDRIKRLVGFYRRGREVYARAGEEYYDKALDASEDVMKTLGVSDNRPGWWSDFATSYKDDLSPHQIDDLKEEAYRQLILLSALRTKPGLMMLKPSRPQVSRVRALLSKVGLKLGTLGLMLGVQKLLRMAWIIRFIQGQFTETGAAAPEFKKALQALEWVRAFEKYVAQERNKPFDPSKISLVIERVNEFGLAIIDKEAGVDRIAKLIAKAKDAYAPGWPGPTNPADFYFLGLMHFFVGRYRTSILAKIVGTFEDLFPELDHRTPLVTAERLLRTAISREPDHFWPVFVLGRTLATRKDFRSAELAFDNCVTIDPKYSRGYEQRALALVRQWSTRRKWWRQVWRGPHLKRALEELRDRSEKDSDLALDRAAHGDGDASDPSTYWPRGELMQEFGEDKKALDAYALGLELEDNILQMLGRSNTLMRVFDYATRLLTANRSQEDDARAVWTEAQAVVALVHLIREEDDDAWKAASEVLVRRPNHTHALTVRGLLQLKQYELQQAADDFRAAREHDPTNDRAALELAKVQERRGEYVEAQDLYQSLLNKPDGARPAPEWIRRAAEDGNDRAALELAKVQERRGEYVEAQDLYQSLLNKPDRARPAPEWIRRAAEDGIARIRARLEPRGRAGTDGPAAA